MDILDSIQEKTEEQAAVFSLLADSTRLKLVKLLCYKYGREALCVNALASFLGVTQSAVSQHLRVLKAAGLVKGRRCGCRVHYFIEPEALERYRGLMALALNVQDADGEKLWQKHCPNMQKDDGQLRQSDKGGEESHS
ncbi:MAG: winged helix-turn-helix transcriptional regulator [Dehalococcoidia bacterium]|nr:winged helix-turn-helix transcriptional regulator [Dehalococcoidia bacterium]